MLKDILLRNLYPIIENYGYKIWYDYDELFIGDDGDYLNFERGLYKSRYVVVIISHALFESPCAISELEQIYELLKNKKIVVIPILYNITAKDVPEKFQWINDIIYTEITTEKETLDVATQISAKYLEDIERFIKYYNEKRIKEKLGWMSPVQYRLHLLAA